MDVDKNKGVIKVYWKDIRNKIFEVEPTFTQIVESYCQMLCAPKIFH